MQLFANIYNVEWWCDAVMLQKMHAFQLGRGSTTSRFFVCLFAQSNYHRHQLNLENHHNRIVPSDIDNPLKIQSANVLWHFSLLSTATFLTHQKCLVNTARIRKQNLMVWDWRHTHTTAATTPVHLSVEHSLICVCLISMLELSRNASQCA